MAFNQIKRNDLTDNMHKDIHANFHYKPKQLPTVVNSHWLKCGRVWIKTGPSQVPYFIHITTDPFVEDPLYPESPPPQHSTACLLYICMIACTFLHIFFIYMTLQLTITLKWLTY